MIDGTTSHYAKLCSFITEAETVSSSLDPLEGSMPLCIGAYIPFPCGMGLRVHRCPHECQKDRTRGQKEVGDM